MLVSGAFYNLTLASGDSAYSYGRKLARASLIQSSLALHCCELKIHYSCEIEDVVEESHLCWLWVILPSRVLPGAYVLINDIGRGLPSVLGIVVPRSKVNRVIQRRSVFNQYVPGDYKTRFEGFKI